MNQRRENQLWRSLNVRRWWLLAFALIVAPGIGLYRMAGSEVAVETAAESAARMASEHLEGCWTTPTIRKWAMSAKQHKYNTKFFMHSMQNVRIDPVEGRCRFELTLTSVDHSAQGAKVMWIETGEFVEGDSVPTAVALRLK